MSDTYILFKDLPFMKAGQKYIPWRMGPFDSSFNSYIPDKVGCRHERFAVHRDYVEDNPEWFKKEEPMMYTKKDMLHAFNAGWDMNKRHASREYSFVFFEDYLKSIK